MSDIKFQLSERIPEEAALMKFLARFPDDRHAEQLRRLALKGFCQEIGEPGHSHRPVMEPAAHQPLVGQAEAPKHCADPATAERPGHAALMPMPQQPGDLSLTSLKDVVG